MFDLEDKSSSPPPGQRESNEEAGRRQRGGNEEATRRQRGDRGAPTESCTELRLSS